MNALEKIALDKLEGQIMDIRKRIQDATPDESFNGYIKLSQMHTIRDVNEALDTLRAIKNPNP